MLFMINICDNKVYEQKFQIILVMIYIMIIELVWLRYEKTVYALICTFQSYDK